MIEIKLLLIDDDEDDYILTKDVLEEIEEFDIDITWISKYAEAYDAILEERHDICLIDYRLGEKNGVELIKKTIADGAVTPLILLTGKGDQLIDIQAMQEGASDYLVKDQITAALMGRSIRYALKNAESLKKVRLSEIKFRQLFERSIDAIYTSDIKHKIIDSNASMIQLLGYDREEVSTMTMDSLFLNINDFDTLKKELSLNKQIRNYESQLRAKNGKAIDCQISSVARLGIDGEIEGYQGIIHDISLRKKAEQDLLVAERLSLTGKIARSIAHEIRNPLTNLGLALDQLKDELPENEDNDMFLGIIERNSKRIDQLITEMLNSSKPKKLEKALCSIEQLMKGAISLIKDRLTLRDLKLVESYDENVPNICIDEEKMKMAFLNILVNAVEAMEDSVGELSVKTFLKDNLVNIEISDNGCGIAPEDIDTLFDPFYTRKQGGMGLGLTSTQNIIQSHGGHIKVTSEVDKGTNFLITFSVQ